MGRLDAVRITVGLTGYDADRAASAFGLIPDGSESAAYFCEYLGGAGHDLPLYDRGVILRLREIGPDAHSTVMLRPCRRGRLTARWLDPKQGVRLEDDWGCDRVLTAALDRPLGPGAIEAVLQGHLPVRRMFSTRQHAFLDECGDLPMPVDDLAVLGPALVHRCRPARWRGYDLVAEWWDTPGGDDILRLELRLDEAGAELAWRGLDTRLLDLGIERRLDRRTTQVMLERLVGHWRGALL